MSDRRRIYVDIDDVLSRTIESLIDLLEHLHGRRVEVDEVRHFDLSRAFALDEEQSHHFMEHAHSDAVIEALEPDVAAASVLEEWAGAGDQIDLVTGRPPTTREASLRWLANHGLAHDGLHHLDKWNRPSWNEAGLPSIGFEDLASFRFDFAVEDNLDTAVRLAREFELPVALIDRPWNRDLEKVEPSTRARILRCRTWDEVADRFCEGFRLDGADQGRQR